MGEDLTPDGGRTGRREGGGRTAILSLGGRGKASSGEGGVVHAPGTRRRWERAYFGGGTDSHAKGHSEIVPLSLERKEGQRLSRAPEPGFANGTSQELQVVAAGPNGAPALLQLDMGAEVAWCCEYYGMPLRI